MLIRIPKLEEGQALELIEKMEHNAGKKRGEIEEMEEIERDKALHMAILRFYTFKPPDTNAAALRHQAFSLANQRYGGYVPPGERENFLRALGIEERMLWSDSEENHTLERIRQPTPKELCSFYNYFSLFNNVKKAVRITALFDKEIAAQSIRELFFLAKRYSMLCDFSRYEMEVYAPQEMLPRNYAYVIMRFLRSIARFSPREIAFSMGYRKLSVLPQDVIACLDVETKEEETVFDSTVEKDFSEKFSPERWQLTRDPFPIIKEDVIFMPDFSLDLKGHVEKRVYLEIIGYWRPEYIKKKREKLSLLVKYNIPLILLVDESLKNNFLGVRYPVFFFSPAAKTKFPLTEIEGYLKNAEKEEYEKVRQRWQGILKEAEERFSGRAFIGMEETKALGFLKDEFIIQARNGTLMTDYRFLPSGFIRKDVLQKIESENLEGPVSSAQKRLESFGLPLKVVTSLGYRITWRSLMHGEVRRI